MHVIVPNAHWEPIFFRHINAVTKLSDQGDLRSTQLPTGDIEVRIWWGFGLSPLEGVTLHRSGGRWTGIHVKADNYSEPTKAERTQISNPKFGWEATWTRLVNERLLSLPDASEINCATRGFDVPTMVVEINSDNTYRTYMHPMSSKPKCDGDKNIMSIIDIIFEEFNLKSSWFPLCNVRNPTIRSTRAEPAGLLATTYA